MILSLVVTPSATGWFDVDLKAYNIIISGDFYVAAYFLVDSSPSFGRDDTSPDSRYSEQAFHSSALLSFSRVGRRSNRSFRREKKE